VIGMLAAGVRSGPLDPPGAPGETDGVRLPGTPIDAPTVISEPGHYDLTRNVTVPAQGTGISIESHDVTLDLGGFTIDGPFDGDIGVHISHNRVQVSNGTIRDAQVGVDASGSNARISAIAVHGASIGFFLWHGTVLEGCVASGNRLGVEVGGAHVVVRDCVISLNDESGVAVVGQGEAHGALIERSSIKANNTTLSPADAGIRVSVLANQATIRENDLGANAVADVKVGGADTVIVDNVLDCPTSIVLDVSSINTFAPVNTTDPHTNRAHKAVC
jgi:hypothetical protein